MSEDFKNSIRKFNNMYKLPISMTPALLGVKRLKDFRRTFQEEVNELTAIIDNYDLIIKLPDEEQELDLLTDLSDWFGDIIVYIYSEALKHGIPIERVLEIIMKSNFSKLGEDGEPMYDNNGKVMRGPNYYKPEPQIKELLKG